MGVTAPSSGDKVALLPAMSVRTQPGQQALIRTSSLPAKKTMPCKRTVQDQLFSDPYHIDPM